MRWSVVGLILLGAAAALCAAVLVAALQARVSPPVEVKPEMVEVVVATKDLPAMTVVDGNCVRIEQVSQKNAPSDRVPPDRVSAAYAAVGRVLSVPMVTGQVFTEKCFAKEGSGVHLAAVLPEGMRAVSVPVEGAAGLKGLLYPGSIVDVFASFSRLPGRPGESGGQTLSMPLIERVQVLAIETNTVFASASSSDDPKGLRRGDKTMVTLMVTPEDAQALQLAMGQGSLMLAMRNPLDQSKKEADFKRLIDLLLRSQPPAAPPAEAPTTVAKVETVASSGSTEKPGKKPDSVAEPPPVPQKKVEVIRGQASEIMAFPDWFSVPAGD